MSKTLLVTGGAGFIGSAVIRRLIASTNYTVVNVDKLTYAGNLESLRSVADNERYHFEKVDICDIDAVRSLFTRYSPDGVLHLAAESHVDRSIDAPGDFIQTNVFGTFTLLQEALRHFKGLTDAKRGAFRFVHISTDEVFGSLGSTGFFTEMTPYQPNSPYSASKASSDHLVRAWHHTFRLPTVTTNCSNNYGPFQFPEKLIPLIILNALAGRELPVYGKGENIRDWLYVEDHAEGLITAFERGMPGETYNFGGNNERTNIDVVKGICKIVDELAPNDKIGPRDKLIRFVKDRPGHDQRYAIDASKAKRELHWTPSETFESGLRKTVQWYVENREWCEHVQSGEYKRERLGLGAAG